MKNLSTIPRLSLSETFAILITLVVCLAGFAEAEVLSNYRKQDSNRQGENYLPKEVAYKENVPYFHQTENGEKNIAKFKIIPEPPLDRLIKRHSDEFGQSEESDERESDGYGYDDDEYYHFNFKRNDDTLENKVEKESVHDVNPNNEGITGQKLNLKSKEKSKDLKTIEMLNFKETHPDLGLEKNQDSTEGYKPYPEDMIHKKQPNTGKSVLTSLKMSDLRENSAIDEKVKDRKDESGLTAASTDSKILESKKSVKGNEEKEGVKLKDSKLGEDPEKKEKEASLREAKETVIAKGLKENSKSSEEKEKGVKFSDSAKLEESLEKISGKTKENDPSKITKEEIGVPRYAEKVDSDVISPNELSQINNRASFVSNDYKDNLNAMKNTMADEEEKNPEEAAHSFQEAMARSREKLRKHYNEKITEPKYGLFNSRNSNPQMFRDVFKANDYLPSFFDQGSKDYFKKRESWKESGGQGLKMLTSEQQFAQQQQQQQASPDQKTGQNQIEFNVDSRYKNKYGFNFPTSDLENTDYHKNYIKSLKRYKSLADEQKLPQSSSGGTDKNEVNKKKMQDMVKRRMLEETPEEKESALNKQKLRRNINKSDSRTNEKCAVEPKTTLSLTKTAKENAKLSDVKKSEAEQNNNRARRKSPLKLEYEIKVIDQSPQDSKNAELLHSTSRRFEKDLKTKLATEDKYSKKYPYSQVSRDDLMGLGETESEKKFKRKAPFWKRHDQKSVIQTRAVPSGYYGNRVKFGQKNYIRNNEKTNSETPFDSSGVSSPYLTGNEVPSMVDKNKNPRSWEVRQQGYKHDPMKRYDDSGNKGNSLFLIKKGERTNLPLREGSSQSVVGHPNPDDIAKILSKENNFVILKRKDTKKIDSDSYSNTKMFVPEEDEQGSFKTNAKEMLAKNKGLHARSFHPEKEDKKLSLSFHNSKSNLRKTFEKFRDLAGFFRDNEQETPDNQYSGPELKEGRDIVFSEDKLPDPIVISTDGSGKPQEYNQKPQNSMYSISTNFKTLDTQQGQKPDLSALTQSGKKMFASEAKAESSESTWQPALKNIFPEAKNIKSLSKNGNEIIILDLNRNRLSSGNSYKAAPNTQQPYGLSSQMVSNNPSRSSQSDGTYQFLMSAIPTNAIPSDNAKLPQKGSFSMKPDNPVNGAYTLVRAGDGLGQLSFRGLGNIPTILKALMENKPITNSKLITKRSPGNAENQVSDNYSKFLGDLSKLSELNKASYRKGEITSKKNENEIVLPPSSFPELSTYGHENIKYLGNLLQTIMTGDNPEFKSVGTMPAEDTNDDTPKFLEDNQKMNSRLTEPDQNLQFQSRLSKANFPVGENKEEDDFLRGEGGDKNYQVLFEGLEAASDKIDRLRREDGLKRKLKTTMEDSLALRQKHELDNPNASLNSKAEDKCIKTNSDSIEKGKTSVDEARDDFKAELKSDDDAKGSSERDKSYLKSNYENHLNEFFENLNKIKNQKHHLIMPSENTWRRKKRKENHRRKRSASVDVKSKVSTTAVQNTILKNLAEDNYQSVYSPGIKRRLFSTSKGADDADNNNDAYERDKNVIAEEAQPKCVKNLLNKCIDPLIVELFGAVDKEEEKNRARRSLTSGFHSNFKREIDLDESMPNDFQNFLVTSLGGFGSQKREVIKKDVALWEGKESPQDSANQIVEGSSGGKDPHEDSTLEKREVSSGESRKTYFPSGSNSDPIMGDILATMNHGEKKIRSEDKSKMKSKVGFVDEKLPTQIRIQITNASSKEKKSSKPIMDESETTSTEMENVPKEKEFFDKNKINAFRLRNIPKVHGPTKSKFSYSEYEIDGEENDDGEENSYRPCRRRRKKKKHVPENPAKPVTDFMKFDQKMIEALLQRVMSDQNMDQTTQKSPVSNHLPQVETVYNPTQGTNKAQLETARFGKLNAAANKNTASVKSSLQSGDSMTYDQAVIRNYLKDKTEKIKSEKGKEFEDIEWKPGSGKMRLRQEVGWESPRMPTLPSAPTYTVIAEPPNYLNPFNAHPFSQKNPSPTGNYFFHPTNTASDNANNLYEVLKAKQDIKTTSGMKCDRGMSKVLKKPFYYNDVAVLNKNEEKEKAQNAFFPNMNPPDGGWVYDFSSYKKPNSQGFKSRDFYPSGIKNQNHMDAKNKISQGPNRKYIKDLEEEKSSALEPSQSSPVRGNSKDSDYMDGADDEYLDDDAGKELQTEEVLTSTPLRKTNQLYGAPLYHSTYNCKNSDVDDGASEDDDEADEDYEETNEGDDLEDYSLFANTKGMEPEQARSGFDKLNSQTAFQPGSGLHPFNCFHPKDNLLQLKERGFEQTEFTNPKNEAKFSQRRQEIPLAGIRMGSMSGTSGLLKKANENANIFEKNLMKSAYGYNFDDVSEQDRLPESKVKELNAFLHHDRLRKRKLDFKGKLKRSREYPQIGSRLFYAAKTEVNDEPLPFLPSANHKSRSGRYTYYRRNPLNAEFADPDNGFENDSEENGKHFNDNLINFGKNFQDEGKAEDEDAWDLEDVAENLEDDGETISEDNVLENVIGKYIMRKRVASPADLSRASEISPVKENAQSEGNHLLNKRSLGRRARHEEKPEIKIVKRLSSGHLTENNFRKYHKKNLSRKRDIEEFDFDECDTPAVGKNKLRKPAKRENPTQSKRSALDLFKKITSKDRDNKKTENFDGRTAGFEPLSSVYDKKYEIPMRDAKVDFLNQLKKLSSEDQQNPIKSNVVEFKAHSPYESQMPLDQTKREKAKTTVKEVPVKAGQGPWRIELNDQYKWDDSSNSFGRLREVEAMPARQENGNLKAFLVFSNNARPPKRSAAEDLPATSGSSQKEVGNSYRRKSGRGIYKMHVRKRSLDSSLVATKIDDGDAAQTPRGRFASEQITESRVDIAEKNRALHDSKSLSEGGSVPQPPRGLQRNAKKIRSFVNADEQCETGRFPSVERLTNRKSVFPPPNDANILGDSRQVNEETSKYLGQQIVNSIMSHVSANPKFKELIAPGLAARTTAYKEGIDIKKKPQADVSEQLQYFLQKFMTDLENLAEKHVRKRMCSQIDQQSKDFLQSLLNLPSNQNRDNGVFGNIENCPNIDIFPPENFSEIKNAEEIPTAAETETPLTKRRNPKELLLKDTDNLKEKHLLLRKLIKDYEKLTKLEKVSLGNYGKFLEELPDTKRHQETPKTNSSKANSDLYPEALENALEENVKLNSSSENHTFLFSNEENGGGNCVSCPQAQSGACGGNGSAEVAQNHVKYLPVYYFDEEQRKQVTYKPFNDFEDVEHYNLTSSEGNKSVMSTENTGTATKKETISTGLPEEETLHLSSPIPQTFDLLPYENENSTAYEQQADRPQISESVRIKESVSGAETSENSKTLSGKTELHKLSLGDAAGLQLSLKCRGPWVSNLDVVKSMRNVADVPQPSKTLPASKVNARASRSMPNAKGRSADAPILEDAKNPKGFAASVNGHRSVNDPLERKTGLEYAVFPYFNFGMFLPKKQPLVRKVEPTTRERIPLSYYLRRASSTGKKPVFRRSSDLAQFPAEKDKDQKSNRFFRISRRKKATSTHYLSPPEKKRQKKRNKVEGEKNSESDDDKNAQLEYLVWSTMPAVRRQLNNLDAGFEFDEMFMKNPKRKKTWKEGEDNLV